LQLDKDTVPKIVSALVGHGLVGRENGLTVAKEPTSEQVNWFVYLNRPGCPRWQDQYAYLVVALAAPLQERQGRRRLKLSPHHVDPGIPCGRDATSQLRRTITSILEEGLELWVRKIELAHNRGRVFPPRGGELPYSPK
jgi:hypothetical protein